jgi:UDP-N-acetylmuramate dehydrogenase
MQDSEFPSTFPRMKNDPSDSTRLDRLIREIGPERMELDVPLAPLTTFKIGGPADALFRARTVDELVHVLTLARELDVPHFLLGRGANVLVADGGFRGLIIHSAIGGVEWLPGNRLRAGAGVDLYPDLIDQTVDRGLSGLHHFAGIPSSVGGALWQNLHFLSPPPERERTVFIAEVLCEAELLTEAGERRTVDCEYFQFGYDYSILHDRADVVLSATFALSREDPEVMRNVVEENLAWRSQRHPDLSLHPSAGSIFQKIEGIGAGRLIDECGLKGRRHGGAEIFHKHANIIVNSERATAAEVRYLIDLARDTVLRETGHQLQTEISFVGDF